MLTPGRRQDLSREPRTNRRAGMKPTEAIVASTRGGAGHGPARRMWHARTRQERGDLLIVGADPTRDVAALRRVRWVMRAGVLRSLPEMQADIARHDAER